jgi:hypothetical protein
MAEAVRTGFQFVTFDPIEQGRIFVAIDEGILKSEDREGHFADASKGLLDQALVSRQGTGPGTRRRERNPISESLQTHKTHRIESNSITLY